jgi:hypothetical protein
MQTLTANFTGEGEMRRYAWLLLLLAGCAEEQPFPRLGQATEAVVFDEERGFVPVDYDPATAPEPEDQDVLTLDAGTRALVLTDDGKEDDEFRPVRVKVLGGKREGLVVRIRRHDLRPAR